VQRDEYINLGEKSEMVKFDKIKVEFKNVIRKFEYVRMPSSLPD